MEVLQVSNPAGLKRLFNNLLEASACSQRALFVGEDELARRANPVQKDTAEVPGRDGLLSHRTAAPGTPAEQRSFAEGRAPFPSCWFLAPSQMSCVQDSSKLGARHALPTATTSSSTSFRAGVTGLLRCLRPACGQLPPGFRFIARATPVSLRCQPDRVLLPELTALILTDSSFMSITAITTLKF